MRSVDNSRPPWSETGRSISWARLGRPVSQSWWAALASSRSTSFSSFRILAGSSAAGVMTSSMDHCSGLPDRAVPGRRLAKRLGRRWCDRRGVRRPIAQCRSTDRSCPWPPGERMAVGLPADSTAAAASDGKPVGVRRPVAAQRSARSAICADLILEHQPMGFRGGRAVRPRHPPIPRRQTLAALTVDARPAAKDADPCAAGRRRGRQISALRISSPGGPTSEWGGTRA